jgi:small subunit ribosomal protein S8e
LVNWQGKSKKKPTGAKLKSLRNKRRFEMGREPIETTLDQNQENIKRVKGGNIKIKLKKGEFINVSNHKTKETFRLKILNVISNKASVDYQRRNVITKGTIVKTEKGNVRITSRPGQHGLLNGILMED